MGPSAILSALFLTLVEMWSSGNCPSSHGMVRNWERLTCAKIITNENYGLSVESKWI